jgi:hypothetical protein
MHNLPYNGRKALIRMRAMKKIARFVALAVVSAVAAGSAFAQNPVYRVRDLVVDSVAPSAADASLQGRNAARLVGAQRLIDRLTLPEDRASARSPLEASAVAQLYRSYETQGEMKSSSVAGGIRATGLVTWKFEEDRVRAYLDQRGVAYVDNQAASSLIVPVAASNVNAADWGAQWVNRSASAVSGKSDETALAPYVGSVQTWTQRPSTSDIQDELSRTHTDHGVIAEVYMQGPQYYVRLTDMRTTVPNPTIGVVGPFVSLSSAQSGAVAELERAWKAASVVRSTGATSVSLIAQFQDIQQWTKIRKGLENSRLVRDLNVESITVVGADISFSYSGRPEQLASDLRSRGVDLRNGVGGGWVLLVSGAP